MKLDTHQHFWHFDPKRHAWIDDRMRTIQRDFMPEDVKEQLDRFDFEGCIAVQVDQTEEETHFLLRLAREHTFVKGVVGWVDLMDNQIEARLAAWAQHERLCGFRHIVQGEADVNFLLNDAFVRGVKALKRHNLTYDVLIYPHQLGAALEFVRRVPDQKLVIDHLAKPYIKDGYIDGWAVLMKEIARYPHVYCKVSGMITEAAWNSWSPEDVAPYLDVVFEAFGVERLMYGSDWPVCLVAGSYGDVYGLVDQYTDGLSETERARLFGRNGKAFYGIEE